MPYYFCMHAEILIFAGRPGDAWRALDEGLRLVEKRRVPSFSEEMYRLQGEILLNAKDQEGPWERGGPAEAERLFQTALERARRNQSRSLELRAALSLGRLWKSQGRIEEARELVARVLDGFTGELAGRDPREALDFLAS